MSPVSTRPHPGLAVTVNVGVALALEGVDAGGDELGAGVATARSTSMSKPAGHASGDEYQITNWPV